MDFLKLTEQWMGMPHEQAVDQARSVRDNCRDCFKDLLDDDHPLTSPEAQEYLLSQLERGASPEEEEEVRRMLRLMGFNKTAADESDQELWVWVDGEVIQLPYEVMWNMENLVKEQTGKDINESEFLALMVEDSRILIEDDGSDSFRYHVYRTNMPSSKIPIAVNQIKPEIESFSYGNNYNASPTYDEQGFPVGNATLFDYEGNQTQMFSTNPYADFEQAEQGYDLPESTYERPVIYRWIGIGGNVDGIPDVLEQIPIRWNESGIYWTDDPEQTINFGGNDYSVRISATAERAEVKYDWNEILSEEELKRSMKGQIAEGLPYVQDTEDGESVVPVYMTQDELSDVVRQRYVSFPEEKIQEVIQDRLEYGRKAVVRNFMHDDSRPDERKMPPEVRQAVEDYLGATFGGKHHAPGSEQYEWGDTEKELTIQPGADVEIFRVEVFFRHKKVYDKMLDEPMKAQAKVAFDFSDGVGSSHRFLISPDGEVHSWDKGTGGYGEALVTLESDGLEEADEDLETDLMLNLGEETFNEFKREGWGTGITSSGGFCLVTCPQLTPAQADVVSNLLRDNGIKTLVFHGPEGKKFFNNPRNAMQYLDPIANERG